MSFRASRIGVVVLAMGLLCLVQPQTVAAQAYDSGFYAGGAVSWALFDGEQYGVVFSEDAFGYKVFGGVDILPYLGIDVARADFGNIDGEEGAAKLSVDAETWAISAVGLIPLGEKFALFAKLGYHFWQYEARATGAWQWWEKDDGGDMLAGFGVRWYLGRHLMLLGEYEAYRVHDFDFDNVNLGVGWKF
jgi:hypothetical protein